MALPRRNGSAPSASAFTRANGYADASEMDKYRLVSNIGKGSFGVISKIQRVEDGKEFALKQLDYGKMTDRDRKQIAAEVAILESLKHRNIVQLVQKIADPKNERIYIVMEYCTSGDLGSLIRKAQRSGQIIHEDKIWNIFLQITLALDHCHWPERRKPGRPGSGPEAATHSQVLHRDLKPENVFLSGDFVKLGDFGLSKDMAGSAFTSTYVGTPLYMPPEILAENRYDTKSDIWSLGCLVFEMCALTSPFATAQTQEELIGMVRSGKLPPLPSRISPALKTAIKAMLNLNPVRRPSTKDLFEMDEMKLHHRMFRLQNQMAVLQRGREELQQKESLVQEQSSALKKLAAELFEKESALVQRENQMAMREQELMARHQELLERENVVRENHLRLSAATESVKEQWALIRSERDRHAQRDESGPGAVEELARPPSEPVTSAGPARPPLDERKTLPMSAVPASSRFVRHPSYDDTPSKVPFPSAFASPVPFATGKIAGFHARRGSNASSLPRRLTPSKSLTNLGSRARADAEERLMPMQSTPARPRMPGTPNRHIAGRTSIGSPGELEKVFAEDVTMATASFAGSPAPSLMPTPFKVRPRKSFSEDSVEVVTAPPTLIPAPTYIYRPEATPAKWSAEDPDCPSPFIRRTNSAAPLLPALTIPSGPASGAKSAVERERPPLSAINPQPASAPIVPTVNSVQRKIPRSRSGSLHQHVLKHNAVRTDAAATQGAGTPSTTQACAATGAGAGSGLGALAALGSLSGGAVRTRPLVGRDPARC